MGLFFYLNQITVFKLWSKYSWCTLLNAPFSIFTPLCSMFYDNALFKMQKYIGDFSIGNSLSRICLLTWRLKTKFLNSEDFLFEATYNEIELEFHSKQIWFSRAYFVRTARLQLFCGYLCVCVCVKERWERVFNENLK